MSLLWEYEEKTHRIITGRKRKKVQKRIVTAVNDGYEVESLTFSNGQYVALMVDTFSLDQARKQEMVKIAEEYTKHFKDEGFKHGLASAVHYIEGLRDVALGLSGPRLPAYDAYMDGFEQRDTPLANRVGAALTAIIQLECARVIGEKERFNGPYRDRNRTRAQAGPHGELLAWYWGWYDAKGQEEHSDEGLKDNRHYMDGWNEFRKLDTQAQRRLKYQQDRERNGFGEAKNPPVTAQVSPAEIERAKTETKTSGPPRSPEELQEHIEEFERKKIGYVAPPYSPEEIQASKEFGQTLKEQGERGETDTVEYHLARRNIRPGSDAMAEYRKGWETVLEGGDVAGMATPSYQLGAQDASELIRVGKLERNSDLETLTPAESNSPAPLSVSFSTDGDPVPPIPASEIAPWLAFHNLTSGSKEEFSYIHGWNRAAGGIAPIPPGIDEWNDRGYQDWSVRHNVPDGDDSEPQSPLETEQDAEPVPLLAAFGGYRAKRGISPRTTRGNYYRNGWTDAADALQVSLNIPDDPENGLRIAYLAGYNDYQEAAVMAKHPA